MSDHNELADHKQRLGTMSARLADAESELRRLRRVIHEADTGYAVYIDGKFDTADADEVIAGMSAGFAAADGESVTGRRVKIVPIDELEASDADSWD
jgi:hypothetical protein